MFLILFIQIIKKLKAIRCRIYYHLISLVNYFKNRYHEAKPYLKQYKRRGRRSDKILNRSITFVSRFYKTFNNDITQVTNNHTRVVNVNNRPCITNMDTTSFSVPLSFLFSKDHSPALLDIVTNLPRTLWLSCLHCLMFHQFFKCVTTTFQNT